jgi:hypothetical protein
VDNTFCGFRQKDFERIRLDLEACAHTLQAGFFSCPQPVEGGTLFRFRVATKSVNLAWCADGARQFQRENVLPLLLQIHSYFGVPADGKQRVIPGVGQVEMNRRRTLLLQHRLARSGFAKPNLGRTAIRVRPQYFPQDCPAGGISGGCERIQESASARYLR